MCVCGGGGGGERGGGGGGYMDIFSGLVELSFPPQK